tara:strand:- start:45 stop:728 length:684 start_codon:yes stop_codon:yes gene_type:complete
MTAKNAIAYIRASTNPELQANSVAIQTAIINRFVESHAYTLTDTFIEYRTGSDDERVEFNKALQQAIKTNSVLITWKVDRLARSMSIFSRIQNHLHLLRFCELGDSEPNIMVLSVLLGVATQERINTSVRVKAAYQTMKAENPNLRWGDANMAKNAQPIGVKVRKAKASAFNMRIQSVVSDLRLAGYTDMKVLVDKLTELGIMTRRGGSFSVRNLSRVLNYEVQHNG